MLPYRPFGTTGHDSSRLIFGGAALGARTPEKAAPILDQALGAGVNHFDTAASYGDSEMAMGPWVRQHRHEIFLATKTGERDGASARAELERSLERLCVDQVDLIQLHNLVEEDDWRQAFAPGGAVEALAQARDEGLVRFVGVTGHGTRIPAMHLRSLREFPFASVLFPLNFTQMQLPSYRQDVEALMDHCRAHSVAMQTIKSIARRRWLDGDDSPHFAWYEPLTETDAITRGVRFALSFPDVFVNTSSDTRWLGAMIAAADGNDSRSAAEVAADRSAPAVDVADFAMSALFGGDEATERI